MGLDFFNYMARESLEYYPLGNTASAITCEGVVIRSPSKILLDGLLNTAVIWIPRGNLAGKVNEIKIGQDEILVKVRPYSAAVRCRVTRLLKSDAYSWKIQATQ